MITITRLTDTDSENYEMTTGFVIIIDKHEDMLGFQELVQRGANLWPDASASIKSFADLVTNGVVQQDYSTQDTSKSQPTKVNYHEF